MTDRTLTPVEARAIHPSRTGSVAESERLRRLLVAGRARVADGAIVEVTERRFTVYAHTTASASRTVTLDAAALRAHAEDLGKEVGELTLDDLRETAVNLAFHDGFPGICAQCSGWGQTGVSLDLGDDWELDGESGDRDDDAVVEVTGEEDRR